MDNFCDFEAIKFQQRLESIIAQLQQLGDDCQEDKNVSDSLLEFASKIQDYYDLVYWRVSKK